MKVRRGQAERPLRRCSRTHPLRAMRLLRRRRMPAARRAAALCFWRGRTAAGRMGAAVRRARAKRATTWTRRPTTCDSRRDGPRTRVEPGSLTWQVRSPRASRWGRVCCVVLGRRRWMWIWGSDVCSGGVSAGPRGVAGCSSRWSFHEQRVGGRREMRWGGDDGLQEDVYARSVFNVPPSLAPQNSRQVPSASVNICAPRKMAEELQLKSERTWADDQQDSFFHSCVHLAAVLWNGAAGRSPMQMPQQGATAPYPPTFGAAPYHLMSFPTSVRQLRTGPFSLCETPHLGDLSHLCTLSPRPGCTAPLRCSGLVCYKKGVGPTCGNHMLLQTFNVHAVLSPLSLHSTGT